MSLTEDPRSFNMRN